MGSVRFFYVFKRSLLCPARLHLFDQKYSKTVIFENYENDLVIKKHILLSQFKTAELLNIFVLILILIS